MEKSEKTEFIDTLKEIQKMKFSKNNFLHLQSLCNQQIQEIKSLSIQADKLINDNQTLVKILSRTEKKVDYLNEFISVLVTKIKALKLQKEYLKKRLKLNNNSFD